MRYVIAIDLPLLLDSSTCVNSVYDIFSSEYCKSVSMIGYDDLLDILAESDVGYELWSLAANAFVAITLQPKATYLRSNPALISPDVAIDGLTKGLLY